MAEHTVSFVREDSTFSNMVAVDDYSVMVTGVTGVTVDSGPVFGPGHKDPFCNYTCHNHSFPIGPAGHCFEVVEEGSVAPACFAAEIGIWSYYSYHTCDWQCEWCARSLQVSLKVILTMSTKPIIEESSTNSMASCEPEPKPRTHTPHSWVQKKCQYGCILVSSSIIIARSPRCL